MEFQRWEPIYAAICETFGYDRTGDQRARDELAAMVGPFEDDCLDVSAATVTILGGGPRPDPVEIDDAERLVVAGSGLRHLPSSTTVDLVVTDLDTDPDRVVDLSNEGTPVAVAAHGDNRETLSRYVPAMDQRFVLGTTQARPVGPLLNAGGFTDGDRAAFITDYFGAAELAFEGWDFDDPSVSAQKRQKLDWAGRLLYWLERQRDERFAILDGRRERLASLPEH